MPPACAAKQLFVPGVGMMEACSCLEVEKEPKTRQYQTVPGEVYFRCFACLKPVDKFLPMQRQPKPKSSLSREQGKMINALSLETLEPPRIPPRRPAGSYLTGPRASAWARTEAAERDEEVRRGAAGPADDVFPRRRSQMEIEGRDREVRTWCWTPTSRSSSQKMMDAGSESRSPMNTNGALSSSPADESMPSGQGPAEVHPWEA